MTRHGLRNEKRRAVLEGLRGRLGARLDARPLGAWECGEAMPGLAPTTYRPVLALSLAIAEKDKPVRA